jgi:hypothetical protein
MHRLLLAVASSACLLAAAGCAREEPQARAAGQSPINCHDAPAARSALCTRRGAGGRGPFYRDTQDGGMEPFRAGCHLIYVDRLCTETPANWTGDYCIDNKRLVEWPDTSCHNHDDRITFNCDALCRRRGHASGACVANPQVCGTRGSAQCECSRGPPRPV